jgi:Fur family ferric uptake transcriptional regulator
MELLLDCHLVSKQTFGKNLAQYEKAYKYKQHDHLICNDCGKVFEFCDPRLQQIQNMAGEMLNFDIRRHSLNFFGDCNTLKIKGECEHNKTS